MLLVEPDADAARAIRAALARGGMRIRTAAGGREALRLFSEEDFDLVVTELLLPEVSGERLVMLLRKESDVPVLVETSKSGTDAVAAVLALGADDYLSKPFSIRELAARAAALLRRRRGLESR